MDPRQLIDLLALLKSEEVLDKAHAVQNAVTRFDIQSGVDRYLDAGRYGHLLGLPTMPGYSSTATTGVPTDGIAGFAPSALFLNFKGSTGTLVYVNTGTVTSATWTQLI